jgi:hypothetical protein
VELPDLADGPIVCGKVVRDECTFASKLIVTVSQLLTEADRWTRLTIMLSLR